ncbi:hypothetical protein [Streptomyces sp. NPDC059278]|uniref:hypothetical protein n=1 Tax=Streptomyces sp. NPDC059278 TaxID=3346801 RepID=UPI0036860C9C
MTEKEVPRYSVPEQLTQVSDAIHGRVLARVIAATGWAHAEADQLAFGVLSALGLAVRELHGLPDPRTGETDDELRHNCPWAYVLSDGEAVFCSDLDENELAPHPEHSGPGLHTGWTGDGRIRTFRESNERAVNMNNWNPEGKP